MTSRMASGGDAATDDQLVAAVRRGNDHAFEELYRRYSAPITKFVGARVRDNGRAEDLVQEIFLSALRRVRATDQTITFRPWIFEIAKKMDMTRPAVESALFRARRRLQQEYARAEAVA